MATNIYTRKNLDEVSFIRPILIILLVIVHSFTVFNGGWPAFDGFQPCETYKWISRLSYSFMLETFTFCSGYVYAFQNFELGGGGNIKKTLIKKCQRLLFPSIIFSILYAQLINDKNLFNVSQMGLSAISILSGIGHLWYLPVLFWCFVCIYFVNKIKYKENFILAMLFLLAILPLPYLPFQLYRLPYYLFYFFLGQIFWRNKDKYFSNIKTSKLTCAYLLFFIVFVTLRVVKADVTDIADNTEFVPSKCFYLVISKTCQLTYATIGMTVIYMTGISFTTKYKLSDWYIQLGNLCFGAYIFQEFILKYLYYKSDLPLRVDIYVLPWVCFTITLVLSLCLSKVTKEL